MNRQNKHFEELEPNYLFPEIRAKVEAFSQQEPDCRLLHFGIGDLSLPLAPAIVKGLQDAVHALGTKEGFHGYGPETGYADLKAKIGEVIYKKRLRPEEIVVSDGAKCDIARLITLIGPKMVIGVQNPCYPAIADSVRLLSGSKKLRLLSRSSTTGLPHSLEGIDALLLVNPNNPTGDLVPVAELKKLVASLRKKKILLLYDSAYSAFIRSPNYPRSIFEIEGAIECAIEVGSLSKSSGFTGLRLGWVAMSAQLRYASSKRSLLENYTRLMQTTFNGASYLSQQAAMAALSPLGLSQTKLQVEQYQARAQSLGRALEKFGFQIVGGEESPFIWACLPGKGLPSWDLFSLLLKKLGWITTPGSGFGSEGEGFLRFSAFAHLEDIQRALLQMEEYGSIKKLL